MILNILKYVAVIIAVLSFNFAKKWWQVAISILMVVFEVAVFVSYDRMVGDDK